MADARPSASDRAAGRQAIRIAFAAALAFAVAELAGWEFSFLAPMLAVQLLVAMPTAPGFRQGIALPLVILAATSCALAISTIFSLTPVILLALVSLVICWSFYGQRRGAPGAVMLLIQIAFCCVPVIATISFDLASLFMTSLLLASITAVVTVWLAYLFIPPPRHAAALPRQSPPGHEPALAARIAISDTLVLLPVLIAFIARGDINNIVILMITLNLLRAVEPEGSGKIAMAIILGNVFGGVVAVLVYQLVILAGSFTFFILIVLATGLLFGERIVRGGAAAPVFAIAFATFLLILGLGISPLPSGSEELLLIRIVKILVASAYTIGALSLVVRLRHSSRLPASPATKASAA